MAGTHEMAGTELTYDEILAAARRLPPGQRKSLVEVLAPPRAEAIKVARRLRHAFRLPPRKQKRLSLLLQRGNAGELSTAERVELDALIEEVIDKREKLATAVSEALPNENRLKGHNGAARR